LSTLVVKEQPLYLRLSPKLIAYGTLGARPTPKLKEWQNSRARTAKLCWSYARGRASRAMTAAWRMHYSHSCDAALLKHPMLGTKAACPGYLNGDRPDWGSIIVCLFFDALDSARSVTEERDETSPRVPNPDNMLGRDP